MSETTTTTNTTNTNDNNEEPKIDLRKFPKSYELKRYNISKRVHILENLKKFFEGHIEFGLLINGKVRLVNRNYRLKELIVELSIINEYDQASVVCRPAENIASRYVLLNNLTLRDVKRFVHDKGYHSHEGTMIVQVNPTMFQIWLNLGRQFSAKKRKFIINYFTNLQTITHWGFTPCFLNMQYEWLAEYDNRFYVRISNGKSFITTVNSNIKYRFSDNLIKHITNKTYEVSA